MSESTEAGNIGASNVLRILGFPVGFVTFLLDALKGMAVVFLARVFGADDILIAASGLAVVAGPQLVDIPGV